MCEHNLYFLYCDCSIASFTPPPRFLLRVYPHFYPRTAPAKRARLDLGGGKGLDFLISPFGPISPRSVLLYSE